MQGSEPREPPTYQETQKPFLSSATATAPILGQISTTKSGPRGHSVNLALTPWVPAAVRLAPSKIDLRSESLVSPPCLRAKPPNPLSPPPPHRFPCPSPSNPLSPWILSHSGPEAWLLERSKGWGSGGWNSLGPGFKSLKFEPDVTCDLADCLMQLKISQFTDCWEWQLAEREQQSVVGSLLCTSFNQSLQL